VSPTCADRRICRRSATEPAAPNDGSAPSGVIGSSNGDPEAEPRDSDETPEDHVHRSSGRDEASRERGLPDTQRSLVRA
jgi:hypothetical protein